MPKAIRIRRIRTDGTAHCEQCQTRNDWTRERARQHADRERHTVRFVIDDITIYRPTEGTDA